MTKDDIDKLWNKAMGDAIENGEEFTRHRFAALVVSNFDPKSFMSWQEGYEVGMVAERESCAELCDGLDDDLVDGLAGWQYGEAIRARGEQAEPPPEWGAINNIIAEYGLQAIDFVADWKAAQPVQEPVAYDKTEMNSFVIDLYDLKMREGKHGHYEALFHCVHQAIARVNEPAAQPEQQAEPVMCRFCHSKKGCWTWQCYHCGEIDDVQQPAAKPVEEPVRFHVEKFAALNGWEKDSGEGAFDYVQRLSYAQGVTDATAHAQPVQEPVAWTTMPEADDWDFVSGNKDPTGKLEGKWFPLYTTPPAAQRPWVGLTEFQFAEIYNRWNDSNGSTPWGLYHAIEKALKAKNHG